MKSASEIVFLSLGSNLGDKRKNLMDAIQSIRNVPETRLIAHSRLWKTAAWGKTDQDDFLNCALAIETFCGPGELMEKIIEIEKSLGRIRNEHWGPRIIDIDILFFGNRILQQPELSIPHPQVENRKFVLVPMAEIAPDFIHPVLKKTIRQLLQDCADSSLVFEESITY